MSIALRSYMQSLQLSVTADFMYEICVPCQSIVGSTNSFTLDLVLLDVVSFFFAVLSEVFGKRIGPPVAASSVPIIAKLCSSRTDNLPDIVHMFRCTLLHVTLGFPM